MTQTKLIDEYWERRLDAWGREFALHRDYEILGHRSKDMLQVLIEHRGEMPPHAIGFKPLEVPPLEMEVEDAVRRVHAWDADLAGVLRAYYCGRGRKSVERLETAQQLLGRKLRVQQFYALRDCAYSAVVFYLSAQPQVRPAAR